MRSFISRLTKGQGRLRILTVLIGACHQSGTLDPRLSYALHFGRPWSRLVQTVPYPFRNQFFHLHAKPQTYMFSQRGSNIAKKGFSLASSVCSYVPMFNANFNEMRVIFHYNFADKIKIYLTSINDLNWLYMTDHEWTWFSESSPPLPARRRRPWHRLVMCHPNFVCLTLVLSRGR